MTKKLSDALGIDHETEIPVPEVKQEIVMYEEPQIGSDAEEDYKLARKTLRSLIEKGEMAIEEIAVIARQNESARAFEVVSTLIKTVGDTTKDLYNLQKMSKDLQSPAKEIDPRTKSPDAGNINVEQAVFVGSAAELLSAIKKKKEEDGSATIQLPE